MPRALFAALLLVAASAHAQLVENVVARSDATQTYTVYLPTEFDVGKKPPLLLIFDPRGRGTKAAEIFRDAAEEYGWVLLSSNQTRSDGSTEPNERAVNALLRETARYGDGRLYAAGFSGTAMLAWAIGIKTGDLSGVIGVGGRFVDSVAPSKFNFAHYGFAGVRDFNNRDMRRVEEALEQQGTVAHRFQEFDGDHRWITPALAREALGWFEVLANNKRVIPRVFEDDVAAADALRGLSALRRYRAILRTYDGLRPVDSIRARVAELERDSAVKRELADEKKWDAFEERFVADVSRRVPALRGQLNVTTADVARAFRVPELRRRVAKEGAEGAAARRLLEEVYVQCSFYLPPELRARGDHALLTAILGLAEELEPLRKMAPRLK